MSVLRVAMMGDGRFDGATLGALRAIADVEIVALGGPRWSLDPMGEHDPRLPVFDDYRAFVLHAARSGANLLVTTRPPHESIEFVKLAADSGLDVIHKPPFARTATEARVLLSHFRRQNRQLIAPRPWRWTGPLVERPIESPHDDHVFAATAHVVLCESAEGWRGDFKRAGGGVLLHGAYEAIDLLIDLFGRPDTVYAQCQYIASPGKPRRYDTEDVAMLTLRFSRGCTATLTALRGKGEQQWRFHLYGTEKNVDLTRNMLGLRDAVSDPQTPCDIEPSLSLAVSTFASQDSDARNKLAAQTQGQMETLATIEAAYLSARTTEAESPARFLE